MFQTHRFISIHPLQLNSHHSPLTFLSLSIPLFTTMSNTTRVLCMVFITIAITITLIITSTGSGSVPKPTPNKSLGVKLFPKRASRFLAENKNSRPTNHCNKDDVWKQKHHMLQQQMYGLEPRQAQLWSLQEQVQVYEHVLWRGVCGFGLWQEELWIVRKQVHAGWLLHLRPMQLCMIHDFVLIYTFVLSLGIGDSWLPVVYTYIRDTYVHSIMTMYFHHGKSINCNITMKLVLII